jgi:hypothetical protein
MRAWMVPLTMSRFARAMVLVLVLALLVVGLPVGMPMGAGAMCPQCVLPAGLVCVLAVLLSSAIEASMRSGARLRGLPVRLPARLWASPIDHPPQALSSSALS